jgi:multicomponent Na+:H+ antiporter subunit B
VILHFIVRILMLPFLIVFAFYTLVHGESGPGGGFQAGAILAAAVILSRLALGSHQSIVRTHTLVMLAVGGVSVYALTGGVPMLFGGTFLDYGHLPIPAEEGIVFGHVTVRSIGIFAIEAGVTAGVMGVLGAMFDYLSGVELSEQ